MRSSGYNPANVIFTDEKFLKFIEIHRFQVSLPSPPSLRRTCIWQCFFDHYTHKRNSNDKHYFFIFSFSSHFSKYAFSKYSCPINFTAFSVNIFLFALSISSDTRKYITSLIIELPGICFWCSSSWPWEYGVKFFQYFVIQIYFQCMLAVLELFYCSWSDNRSCYRRIFQKPC